MKHLALVALLGFASAAAMAHDDSYGNVAGASSAYGAVNSQSQAHAASTGNGMAFTATQSGAFATYGQSTNFVSAPTGAQGGTAVVAGFAQTQEYSTSESVTTGTGRAGSSSWNSANAGAQSRQDTALPGYTGAATGVASSYVGANVETYSHGDAHDGTLQIQGNSALNTSTYSATDSGILTPGSVTVSGVVVPVQTVQTETSAVAQSNSVQTPYTTFGSTVVQNAGSGENYVVNGGDAKAVAN